MASRFVRVTVTVPADLKARMDAAKGQLNWSAIAARALEAALVDLEVRSKSTMSREDVVKRMRVRQEEEGREDYAEGVAAGKRWAEQEATPKELRRLDRLRAGLNDSEWSWQFDTDDGSAYGPSEWLVFTIRPEEDGNRQAAEEFWEMALGGDAGQAGEAEFVRGFAEGALEVWADVGKEV